jgi:hypothetical protein
MMSDLSKRLRDLADKFSKGWHDGIKIDATDIELLADAAAALAEPEQSESVNGWLEAAIAWEVCASIHEDFAKGKDALYKTRHSDFVNHAERARKNAAAPPRREPLNIQQVKEMWRKHAPNIGGIFDFAAEIQQYHGIGGKE